MLYASKITNRSITAGQILSDDLQLHKIRRQLSEHELTVTLLWPGIIDKFMARRSDIILQFDDQAARDANDKFAISASLQAQITNKSTLTATEALERLDCFPSLPAVDVCVPTVRTYFYDIFSRIWIRDDDTVSLCRPQWYGRLLRNRKLLKFSPILDSAQILSR